MVTLVDRSFAVALGAGLDRLVGDPPNALHPVAAFGSVMGRVERVLYRDGRTAGAAYTGAGVGLGIAAGTLVRSVAVATVIAVAGRSLGEAARAVDRARRDSGLDAARAEVRALVGRDPAELDEQGIARAVVESVAENTVDAVIAPMLWGALLGAPGVLGYRAINTMDAMVGHHSERYERFGWAAARLDDVANWVPARIAALLVVAVRPRSASAVARAVKADAPGHPSPNAGVVEAAFAAALGVRLGGENRYGDRVEVRATLGDGRPVTAEDVASSVRLSRDVTALLAALLALPRIVRAIRARPARRRGR